MSDAHLAGRLVELGNAHHQAGRITDAEAAYRAAIAAASDWSVPYYDLGLLCKYARRWRESLELNQRATTLDPHDEAAWWNLGIAATAMGEWAEARRAWQACGISISPGDTPPYLDYGSVPVRLDPDGEGEVVWAHRLDPARARILNVPLPTSPFRCHDIVLHDGAPEGYRTLHGRNVPVFNVLDRMERSVFQTFIVELGTADPEAIQALERIADAAGGAAEHWGTSTNILCRQCSFGTPHPHSDDPGAPAHPHCGIAARDGNHVRSILDQWLAASPSADLVRWYVAPHGAGVSSP